MHKFDHFLHISDILFFLMPEFSIHFKFVDSPSRQFASYEPALLPDANELFEIMSSGSCLKRLFSKESGQHLKIKQFKT